MENKTVRRLRLYTGVALLFTVLALPSAGCSKQVRIITDLPPDEFIPYVELSDGFLYFTEDKRMLTNAPFERDLKGIPDIATYETAVAELGFDPAAVTAQLPERLRFDAASLDTEITRIEPTAAFPNGEVEGGYTFRRRGDPGENYRSATVALYPDLILRIQRGDGELYHYGATHYKVLTWERRDPDVDRAYHVVYERSQVGEIELGATHFTKKTDLFPNSQYEYYYAGFYAGDWAISLENWNGYCTQEEFIQVLLTILDAAAAAQ